MFFWRMQFDINRKFTIMQYKEPPELREASGSDFTDAGDSFDFEKGTAVQQQQDVNL